MLILISCLKIQIEDDIYTK